MSQENKVTIPLKSGEVYFEDIIELEEGQLRKITDESFKKTLREWLHKDTKGLNIVLTDEQKQCVLDFKNEVVEGLQAEELIDEDYIQFLSHAMKRVNYRLESRDPDELLERQELVKLAQAVIDSSKVLGAQWKGRSNLSYRFLSTYDGKSIEMSLVFADAVLVITIIVPKGGPAKKDAGFSVGDIIKAKHKKGSPFR